MYSLACYTDGQFQINQTCYKNDQEIDSKALLALDGLNELLNESELQVTEEIQRTNEMAQQAFQQMKGQFAALLEENRKLREQLIQAESQQSQLKTIHQSEIAALKEESGLAKKSLEDLRQEMADSFQKSEAEKKALIQDKNDAVKIAVEAGNARVNAIKQQIKANIGRVYLKDGHWVDKRNLISIGIGSGVYCSCHKDQDPNNYYYTVYARYKSHYPNDDQRKWLYEGERPTREALAKAHVKQIEALEKISS